MPKTKIDIEELKKKFEEIQKIDNIDDLTDELLSERYSQELLTLLDRDEGTLKDLEQEYEETNDFATRGELKTRIEALREKIENEKLGFLEEKRNEEKESRSTKKEETKKGFIEELELKKEKIQAKIEKYKSEIGEIEKSRQKLAETIKENDTVLKLKSSDSVVYKAAKEESDACIEKAKKEQRKITARNKKIANLEKQYEDIDSFLYEIDGRKEAELAKEAEKAKKDKERREAQELEKEGLREYEESQKRIEEEEQERIAKQEADFIKRRKQAKVEQLGGEYTQQELFDMLMEQRRKQADKSKGTTTFKPKKTLEEQHIDEETKRQAQEDEMWKQYREEQVTDVDYEINEAYKEKMYDEALEESAIERETEEQIEQYDKENSPWRMKNIIQRIKDFFRNVGKEIKGWISRMGQKLLPKGEGVEQTGNGDTEAQHKESDTIKEVDEGRNVERPIVQEVKVDEKKALENLHKKYMDQAVRSYVTQIKLHQPDNITDYYIKNGYLTMEDLEKAKEIARAKREESLNREPGDLTDEDKENIETTVNEVQEEKTER